MKTTTHRTVGVVGLVDWLKQPAPRYSLAVGANCGCDISRLGRDICDYLNRQDPPVGGHCRSFDSEEIRRLAGDSYWRHSIHAAAGRLGHEADSRCDYENMVRAIAALGGAILTGHWALDATGDLDNVFRVALSHCDQCCPESSLTIDPNGFSQSGLAAVIGKRFLRWCEERSAGPTKVANTDTRLHAIP